MRTDPDRNFQEPGAQLPSSYVLLRDPVGFDDPTGSGWAPPRIHLREYWRVLLRYRWVIAASFLAIVASTAIIVFTMRPRYTGIARIEIERRGPKIAPSEGVDERRDDSSYDQKYDYYQTQFKILQSRTIAERVIRALALDSDARFVGDKEPGFVEIAFERLSSVLSSLSGSGEEADAGSTVTELGVDIRLVEHYQGNLRISPVLNSRLVDVTFTSFEPTLSADVANRHVEEFVNAELEERVDLNRKAKRFLEQEMAKARDRVVSAEAALNAYRKANRVLSVDGRKTDIVSERLADLNARHTEAQAERIRLEGQYQLIQKRNDDSLPDVIASNLITDLKKQLAVAEAERAQLAKRFKPGYPKMKEAAERESQIRQRLNAEIAHIVGGIESGYLAARSREDGLLKELEAQREVALAQKDIATDYGTLQRDVETGRDVYKSLLKRLRDIDVTEEIKLSTISVVDRAIPPTRPSVPRKKLSLGIAIVGGLSFGMMLALFLNYMDNTLRTPDDVRERLDLPMLGVVPGFDSPALAYGAYGYARRITPVLESRGDGSSDPQGDEARIPSELVLATHPRSVISEAYRTIRTKILLSSADSSPQIIVFTSALAGEGKTVTVVNQALALVQTGGRVLIVDADIRRPRIHAVFKEPNGHGLSTYLSGQSDLQQTIRELPLNGVPRSVANGDSVLTGTLHMISAGPLPPNPAELLGSKRMRDTLNGLRESYDYILIDTPPVLLATDAVLLSTASDGVVLVIRGEETAVTMVRRAREDLEGARAKILGVVLNDVDITQSDYSEYYGDYRSYGDSDASDSAA